MNKSFLKVITLVVAISSGIGFSSSSVLSADLKVALAAEPTSMDPHYQNLTINNSFSTQVYNALVLQDVNQNLLPGLAKSWKPIDQAPDTFNFGNDFSAILTASLPLKWSCALTHLTTLRSLWRIFLVVSAFSTQIGPSTLKKSTGEISETR